MATGSIRTAISFPDGDRIGQETAMKKFGFKALTAILTIGRRSRRHVDWTRMIILFSTIVTIALVVLYILDRFGEP
jgi:hypothetical protein